MSDHASAHICSVQELIAFQFILIIKSSIGQGMVKEFILNIIPQIF
jgi:hypothetical protein